jgi:hypothetical protein
MRMLTGVVAVCLLGGMGLASDNSGSSAAPVDGPLTVDQAVLGTGQERLDRIQEVNDLTTGCMRERGWEYWSEPARLDPAESFLASVSVETAARWGYGLTAMYTRPEQFEAEFGSWDADPLRRKNLDYAKALDPDVYGEYLRDLNGAIRLDDLPEDISPAEAHPYYDESCQGEAEAQVYGATAVADMPALEEQEDQAIADALEVVISEGYEDAWSRCMAEHGYEFTVLGSADDYIVDKLLATLPDSSDDMTDEIRQKLEALDLEEREIATADVGCMESTGLLARGEELEREAVAEIMGEVDLGK